MAPTPQPQLRRQNKIRTVLGSVAIEGNTLTLEQVTAVLDNRRVVGSKREIAEVRNAIATYAHADGFDPAKERDLLKAHNMMMRGLADDAGAYRTRGVGVFQGANVTHVAPPAKQVPRLVDELLHFLRTDATHALIKSALVHYELEFIHPFSDGNGRMGRLWQHVVLLRFHPIFEFVPFESVIKTRQEAYYRVLGECDKAGDASAFAEFSLQALEESLREFLDDLLPEPATASTRLALARSFFERRDFSRRDYRNVFKVLSTATASRDLRHGTEAGLLVKTGDKAATRYRFFT